jgi:error-prone DNA polymerase
MKIGMVAANLIGGEAQELRKAMGGKRSESIIAGLKTRLHKGMTANGFDAATREEVMRVLATVKEFMFPESHAHMVSIRCHAGLSQTTIQVQPSGLWN